MEITALKCNGCEHRCFLEDDESVHWATATFTVPATKTRVTVHYCPQCNGEILSNAARVNEKLDTGKRQVVSPAYVDPQLQAMMTHDEDQATATGFVVAESSTGPTEVVAPAWNAPEGPPLVGGPILPPDNIWNPAPSAIPRGNVAPRQRSGGKRKRVSGGARQATRSAITQTGAWLPHFALTFAGMLAVALHVARV